MIRAIGQATDALLLAVQPASAQKYPRISVDTPIPTEYFNACALGPGCGVTDYDGGAGNGQLARLGHQ